MTNPDYPYYELAFGKRPAEELFEMEQDPDCVRNLADDPNYATLKAQLWSQLQQELTQQGDPRMLDGGDIFDYYPNLQVERQQRLYQRPDWNPIEIFNQKTRRQE